MIISVMHCSVVRKSLFLFRSGRALKMNFYAALDVLYCDLVHTILMKYLLSDYLLAADSFGDRQDCNAVAQISAWSYGSWLVW